MNDIAKFYAPEALQTTGMQGSTAVFYSRMCPCPLFRQQRCPRPEHQLPWIRAAQTKRHAAKSMELNQDRWNVSEKANQALYVCPSFPEKN